MKSILEILFNDYVTEKKNNEAATIVNAEIEMNKERLKRGFNKNQKKLLLRIIDAKDLRHKAL